LPHIQSGFTSSPPPPSHPHAIVSANRRSPHLHHRNGSRDLVDVQDNCDLIVRVKKSTEGSRRRLVCPVTYLVDEMLRESDRRYAVVNLGKREHTCRLWQEQQYPCYHACAAIMSRKESPIHYIIHYYTIDALKRVFAPTAIPIDIALVTRDATLPPQIGKKCRRPKKVRLRSRSVYLNDDSPVHCSKCGQAGHNIRTCDRRQKQKMPHKKSNLS
jgi:hypothetical protein